jgi:hypothetical protein
LTAVDNREGIGFLLALPSFALVNVRMNSSDRAMRLPRQIPLTHQQAQP